MTVKGKRVLITGASRGIGKAAALKFASLGARLHLVAISAEVFETARLIKEAGGEVAADQVDLTDGAQVRMVIQNVRRRLGGFDVLVNNAGLLVPGVIGMIKDDDIKRMIALNITAVVNLTQYASRSFGPAGGAVINIASIAGTRGLEGMSAYSATKAGVIGFTLAAAGELAKRKIRVNAIAPGFIETDMTRSLGAEVRARALANIRIGRFGKPEDVANCVVFLASDEADYITGQVVGVDGGMIA